MAGSWIEALYISTQICITSMDNEKIVDIITEQNSSLEKLIEVMEPIKESEMAADIYVGLGELHDIFKGVNEKMTSEQLEELVVSTDKLRTMIVS